MREHAAANVKGGLDLPDLCRFGRLGRNGRAAQHIEAGYHTAVQRFTGKSQQVCATEVLLVYCANLEVCLSVCLLGLDICLGAEMNLPT